MCLCMRAYMQVCLFEGRVLGVSTLFSPLGRDKGSSSSPEPGLSPEQGMFLPGEAGWGTHLSFIIP